MYPLVAVLASLLLASSAAQGAEQPIELLTQTGALKGVLFTPSSQAKPPVVLILAGSGPTDKDGNTPLVSGKNDSLKLLAAALAEHGIASVRYDKRGIAGSAGARHNEIELRLETYVEDAAAWVDKLTKDARFSAVHIIGHSEGSLIGMLAAGMRPVASFVSIAGPADSAALILRRQLAGRLPPELVDRNEAILSSLAAGRTAADVPPQLMALYRPSVQPYLISWFRRTPTKELAKLTMPCLIVQGTTDIQISVSDAEALGASGKACKVTLIPGMNHVLKMVPLDQNQQVASYGNPSLPISPALTQVLVDFFLSGMASGSVSTRQ